MKSIYIYFVDEKADIYYKDNSKNLHCTINLYTTNKEIREQFRKNLLQRYWDRLEINDIDDLKMIVKDSFVQIFTLQRENFDKND
jgi:ornithine cyclodeaminase/alanine dehydrogenase-like protein (mu-crystallin family)